LKVLVVVVAVVAVGGSQMGVREDIQLEWRRRDGFWNQCNVEPGLGWLGEGCMYDDDKTVGMVRDHEKMIKRDGNGI
jgi:hypothetical protein